jgi:hypothetical protein
MPEDARGCRSHIRSFDIDGSVVCIYGGGVLQSETALVSCCFSCICALYWACVLFMIDMFKS